MRSKHHGYEKSWKLFTRYIFVWIVTTAQVTRKLNIVQGNLEGVSRGGNMQAQIEVDNLCKKLEEKDYELDSLINLNNTLIAKECRSNHELQEARKVLIEQICEILTLHGLDGVANVRSHPVIGLKWMGELNDKPFRDICIKMFPTTEWETNLLSYAHCGQHKIQDSGWYPYKHVTIDKKIHEVINEDDEKLRELKDEWGKEVYDVVATASLDMNQYNPSGRYPVWEI